MTWVAMICLDMNVISDISTAIQQFLRRFRVNIDRIENPFLLKHNDKK